MDNNELKRILEALLMSADKPLTLDELISVFDDAKPNKQAIVSQLESLKADYAESALELCYLGTSYSFKTKSKYGPWIGRLQADKPAKYSRALLETLAIIAYKQPVTRADIEEIRGVAVSTSLLKTLLEREWIRVAGHRDVPGKPAIYTTTQVFLQYFNLNKLSELPPLVSELISPSCIEECLHE